LIWKSWFARVQDFGRRRELFLAAWAGFVVLDNAEAPPGDVLGRLEDWQNKSIMWHGVPF
jgi:hypothetical protein